MKKIIAAFDGLKFSEGTRDYAIHLAKQCNAHLVAVFLDDPHCTSYKVHDLVIQDGVNEQKLKKYQAQDESSRAAAAENIENACKKAGLNFSIHHDRNFAIRELIHESVYADFIIVDNGETLTHYSEPQPTTFIQDLLIDSQCPVLVVPHKYHPIDRLILLYDGEPSSVHAVKMFSYLLSPLKQIDTELLSVNAISNTLHLPDGTLMKEFMKRHYPAAKFTVVAGWPEEEILKFLKEQPEHSLVIMGAYRRGSVSRWFRTSMADMLMKELKMPLFIAHNK